VTPLLVALGAAAGAALRFLAAHHFDEPRFHWGTLVVNTAGSFLLGAFSAMVLSGSLTALMGVGFCGGLTTYSAFAVQAHGSGAGRGAAYAAATVLLALLACAGGYALYA
jgi:CrcB protein